jgi:hypothetical protein
MKSATRLENAASYNEAMRRLRRGAPVAFALILSFTTSSCLYTKRVILRRGKPVSGGAAPKLMTATREGLLSRISNVYNAIQSFQATVDLTPSLGSVYKGQITEFKDVRGFILFRKPAEIRVIGQAPVVRSTVFDMVSNGTDFKVNLATRGLFFVGLNSAPPVPPTTLANSLENLRPEAFLSALLIHPPAEGDDVVLEDDTDEENAIYELLFLRRLPSGQLMLDRNIWFDRLNLSMVRQRAFDADGNIVSDTRYDKWTVYNGVVFPAHIDLNRDKDGYGVVIDVVAMQMNRKLTDAQFVLTQPEGAQLRTVGSPIPPAPPGRTGQ